MKRPTTLGDFQRLGAARRGGRTAREAKALHDQRQARYETVPIRFIDRILMRAVNVPLGLAGNEYFEAARAEYPRRRNWLAPRPYASFKRQPGWSMSTLDLGRYSSRCHYTHYAYIVNVRSFAHVTPNWIVFWFADRTGKRIAAPFGYHWQSDDYALRLVSNNTGDAYRPDAHELLTLSARQLAQQVRAVAEQRKAAERMAQEPKRRLRRAEQAGVRVSMADAVNSGSCLDGILRWAISHGLDPQKSYRPLRLLAVAEASDTIRRLMAAVAQAELRHAHEIGQ